MPSSNAPLVSIEPVFSRRLWALAVSLGLHGALFAWLSGRDIQPRAAPASIPLQVEIVSLPARPPHAQTPDLGPHATGPIRPSVSAGSQTRAPSSPSPAERLDATLRKPTGPAALNLLPRVSSGDSIEVGSEPERGRTLRNDGSAPRPSAERAAKEAGATATRWLQRDVAELRAASGAIGPYFVRMKRALETQTATIPVGVRAYNGAGAASLKAAQRYGASSAYAPTGPASGERPPPSPDSEITTGSNNESIVRALAPLTQASKETAQEASLANPLATIEIRQEESGELVSASLDSGSGNARFDRHILQAVLLALRDLEPPEHGAAGVHPEGIRTLWSFEGLPNGGAVRCLVRLVAVF